MKEGEEQITVDLDKDLIGLFRETAGKKYNWKRGYIKKGITLAIKTYLESEGKEIPPELKSKIDKITK